MFYEEAKIDGAWHYRTTPNGEWREGRLDFTAAQQKEATNGQE